MCAVCLISCQTGLCDECEFQGLSHGVGDRWRTAQCQMCQCLSNLTVQCAYYCPYTMTGCPQVCVWNSLIVCVVCVCLE